MTPLILKRAPIGWNQEDYEVLEDGVVVGRVFLMPIGLKGRPWMWAIRERKGSTPRTDTRRHAKRRWRRSPGAGDGNRSVLTSAKTLVMGSYLDLTLP
jgi:hypothetical protein